MAADRTRRFQVFLPDGKVMYIEAVKLYETEGRIFFFDDNKRMIAIFAPGGWSSVVELENAEYKAS